MLTPKEWITRERARYAHFDRVGVNYVADFPWQPWEDHLLYFYDYYEAQSLLRTRTLWQIRERRKKLGLKNEPEVPGYEICPTCKTHWRMAA